MLLAFDYVALDAEVSTSDLAEWREAASREEEPMTQVKVAPNGCWHKTLIDWSRTACGQAMGAYATRDASYAGKLCQDGCFSPYELQLAKDLNAQTVVDDREKRNRAAGEHGGMKLENDIAESRAGNRKRLDTARNQKPDPEDK